jgi:hypothetical protein
MVNREGKSLLLRLQSWHAKFDELNHENPSSQGYCGYYRDLDMLCALMVHVLRPALGEDASFHILMPALGPLCILDPLRFPPAIGHLRLKGELDTASNAYPDDGNKYLYRRHRRESNRPLDFHRPLGSLR